MKQTNSLYKNTYVKNGFVSENIFRSAGVDLADIPDINKVRNKLPKPHWKNHAKEIEMYWKAWDTAFSNILKPTEENGFIRSYLDTAYNGNIFMWDSVFITHFSRYGSRVFPFQGTLDNFYNKQHLDGFICREIWGATGGDAFHRYDPASTGPNIFSWSELEYYKAFGNSERLENVFPVLSGFHQWLQQNRTWKDGSYWSSGWGTGMDNIPRLPPGYNNNFSHGHTSWLDTNIQSYIDADNLLKIGFHLERWQEIEDIETEKVELAKYIKENMWDKEKGFLFDIHRDGITSDCKHIGAFWILHTDLLDKSENMALISHLLKGGDFDNPRPVPSISPKNPGYRDNGRYWQGGIWAPTDYMILSGLQKQGFHSEAFDLGRKHLSHVLEVFKKTGTFWEYYSPEKDEPGVFARSEFVGWTGLTPISVLFEIVFGIRPFYDKKEIQWTISITDEHGVENYPFGPEGNISLKSLERKKKEDQPVIEILTDEPFTLIINHEKSVYRIPVAIGKSTIKNCGKV